MQSETDDPSTVTGFAVGDRVRRNDHADIKNAELGEGTVRGFVWKPPHVTKVLNLEGEWLVDVAFDAPRYGPGRNSIHPERLEIVFHAAECVDILSERTRRVDDLRAALVRKDPVT